MPTKLKLAFTFLTVFLIIVSCKDEQKYTPLKNASTTTPIKESTTITNASFKDDLHTVKVNEMLKTDKYLYLNVSEKGTVDPFWIATRISDITVGETYFYKGGLLKTNFESKEFNRVFDKIYLVSSNLVLANHASNTGFKKKADTPVKAEVKTTPSKITSTKKTAEVKGSVKIADLVKNVQKYAGKTIQISGTCSKINAEIMGKNWIHLRDGSQDDYDLVVTSAEMVNEGDVITIKAVVTLNKDFGAGYKYDLILEDGTIVR